MRLLDFRSDTVTKPSPEMRRAMAEAPVGDDVYGEDPTVRRLEERTAELLGHPAGLFVTSGTQANQIAIGLFCRPGDEVIAEAGSHCINSEAGGIAALWGAQPRAIVGERGLISTQQLTEAVRPSSDHYPRSKLLCIENTHNRGGGTAWPISHFRSLVAAARQAGLNVHLDGARLFNAQVATGTGASEYGKLTDTTCVCFSKGLGAPVGSVLCASTELAREGRRLRRRLGGGMRQAGILAAAGLYALEHNISRLAEDHANARKLAQLLSGLGSVEVDPSRVETNIVFAGFPGLASDTVAKLRRAGVLVNAEGARPNVVRWVCHLDVTSADVEEAVARVKPLVRASA
jgi:threonine aldolase